MKLDTDPPKNKTTTVLNSLSNFIGIFFLLAFISLTVISKLDSYGWRLYDSIGGIILIFSIVFILIYRIRQAG